MTIGASPICLVAGHPAKSESITKVGTSTTQHIEIWWGPGDGRTDHRYSAAKSSITPNRIGLACVGLRGWTRFRVGGVLLDDRPSEPWPSVTHGNTKQHIRDVIQVRLESILAPTKVHTFDVGLIDWGDDE